MEETEEIHGIMNAEHSNGVAAGKRSLKLAAMRLLAIMNAGHSNGVAERKRSLNHEFQSKAEHYYPYENK